MPPGHHAADTVGGVNAPTDNSILSNSSSKKSSSNKSEYTSNSSSSETNTSVSESGSGRPAVALGAGGVAAAEVRPATAAGGSGRGSSGYNSNNNNNGHHQRGGGGGGNSVVSAAPGGGSLWAAAVSVGLLAVTLGLITCVVSHYRGGGSAPPAPANQPPPQPPPLPPHYAQHAPDKHAPMLSVVSAGVGPATGRGEAGGGAGGAGRLHRRASRDAALQRDHLVRQKSVYTDIVLDLPPSIPLPDGEELPYGSSIRLQIRDAEQESEIYQKCIKPPPNRSVFESESPPPYRSNSAGVLGALPASSISSSSSSSSSSSTTGGVGGGSTASDLSGGAPLVVRCHSMSSTSKRSEAKTDFLQRTVKILTGKKTGTAASSQSGGGSSGVGRPPSNV